MKFRMVGLFAMAAAIAVLAQANVGAGDKKKVAQKDVTINAELNNGDVKDKVRTNSFCKTYTYKMVAGHKYQIDMVSKEFDTYLRLEDPKGMEVAVDDDGGGDLNARIIYKATETGDFTICATTFAPGGKGKFTLMVKEFGGNELKLDNGKASVAGKLAAGDPKYKERNHKPFFVNLVEGKSYQIDMTSTQFDSYLFLEDPDGKLIAEDDDGGGFPNARIVIRAAKTGKHRVIASHFGDKLGEFNLTIAEK
jgi:hypothetical protein